MRAMAMTARAWPFEEARRILKRYQTAPPEKGFVLFETGYGPSGLPHIGTFGEVARTSMIRRAFQMLSDIPTKLVCFSDDMDGMRKVPDNVPNPELLGAHLNKPLTTVPDPFGKYESFGHHNNAMLRRFLDTFGFDYDFVSATEFYRSGAFDTILLRAAAKYDALMQVMLPTLREERASTYSIFLPISPSSGRVLYVPLKAVDGKAGTITFDDEDGSEKTLPVTGGHVKLQWKPDFGARWAALGVDFEMYGKDHSTNTPIYDRICSILGQTPPEHFTYELFLDENGEKISKSRGNGIAIDEWLSYGSTESLAYYMFQKPKTAKRLHFDVIPKAVDEYYQQRAAYAGQDDAARLENPVWHIHGGAVPDAAVAVSFALLLNLASVCQAEDSQVIWSYLAVYAPGTSPQTDPELDRLVQFAVTYYRERVRPFKRYRAPDAEESKALNALAEALRDLPEDAAAEDIQSAVFAVGKEAGYEQLRDWFGCLYQTLLGQEQGPRMGSFIRLYGVAATITLIGEATGGALAAGTSA